MSEQKPPNQVHSAPQVGIDRCSCGAYPGGVCDGWCYSEDGPNCKSEDTAPDIPLSITVLYSCQLCRLKDVPVEVPARESEDVVTWMNAVGVTLSDDHHRRSPHCHPKTLTNIKIPITNVDRLGGAPAQ